MDATGLLAVHTGEKTLGCSVWFAKQGNVKVQGAKKSHKKEAISYSEMQQLKCNKTPTTEN